jgi:hypothetical protein
VFRRDAKGAISGPRTIDDGSILLSMLSFAALTRRNLFPLCRRPTTTGAACRYLIARGAETPAIAKALQEITRFPFFFFLVFVLVLFSSPFRFSFYIARQRFVFFTAARAEDCRASR